MIKSESVKPAQSPLFVLRAILLILCFFFGVFGIFFFIWKQNYSASTSCLILELVSITLLNITITARNGKLHEKYNESRLKIVFILSVILAVAEFVSTLSYAALGTIHKQGFQIEMNGYYVAIIPSSLACIWSSVLAYESRTYMAQFTPGVTTMAQF